LHDEPALRADPDGLRPAHRRRALPARALRAFRAAPHPSGRAGIPPRLRPPSLAHLRGLARQACRTDTGPGGRLSRLHGGEPRGHRRDDRARAALASVEAEVPGLGAPRTGDRGRRDDRGVLAALTRIIHEPSTATAHLNPAPALARGASARPGPIWRASS